MKKYFDAVAFQRKIRERLGKAYLKNRKAFVEKLKEDFRKERKKAA